MVRKNLNFPREKNGSYLRASRLTPGTVGVKPRANLALATQISDPLSRCVSSVPNSSSIQNIQSSIPTVPNIQRADSAHRDLLGPIPSFPLSSVLGAIEFIGKSPSNENIAVAALNPGTLKHGKEVDINHLHFPLANTHESVFQATAKQHGLRLTRELVSCAACSMAKENRAPTPHHTTARVKIGRWS